MMSDETRTYILNGDDYDSPGALCRFIGLSLPEVLQKVREMFPKGDIQVKDIGPGVRICRVFPLSSKKYKDDSLG
jgi:hypothetical protein